MKGIKKELLSVFVYLLLVLVLAGLMKHFVIQRTVVEGHSMENTLKDKDQLIIDKLTYRLTEPKRFDIVVFPYQYDEDVYYIKRIIGLPGETVLIAENTIYIDGEPLIENYGKEAMDEDTAGIAKKEIVLSEDEYFVLGDNRNNSTDSRSEDVGAIKKDTLIGRAVFRIFPLKSVGLLPK